MDLRLSPEDRVATDRGQPSGGQRTPSGTRGGATPPRKPKKPATRSSGPSNGSRPGRKRTVRPWSIWRAIGQVFKLGLVLAFWGVVAVIGVIVYFGAQLPSADSWAVPDRPPNIRVLASNGELITNRGQTGGENIAYHELPAYVPLAIVANEDRRFYDHFGVDVLSYARIMIEAATTGRMRGGSTITQQVARTLFLNTDQTIGRKVQEALLAVWLEQNYSKQEILELYLNRVHFGAGATGIEAAAQTYFGISARNLTLGQAAMLAGILPSPATYNPRSHPERALERQRLTLLNMVREGYITEEEAANARNNDDEAPSVQQRRMGAEYYVADWVETLMNAYLGPVYQDVIVYTTLDLGLQRHAEQVVQAAIAEYGAARNFNQAALVAMDTEGRVLALVGGVDYSASQYNRAVTARRQPGSSFKPFVYLAALQQGYTPDTLMIDQPINYNGWSPENYSRTFQGPVLLRDALASSINTIAAQLAIDIGPENVVETAYRMGFSSQFQPVPSISLGAQEVSLLELTGAYAPFANGGMGVIPSVITRITTMDGEVLYEESLAGPGQVISIEQVGMMNDMLRAVVTNGTGGNAQFGGWQIGGKTGTTQSSRDALFVGYTARMVAGVWLGNDDDSPTSGMTGGAVPSRIWANFMSTAHQGLTPASLPGNYVRLADRISQPADPFAGQQVPANDGIGQVINNIFAAPQ